MGYLMVYAEKRARGVTRLTGGALAPYPVGAIYQSLDPTDPGVLFGGTWVRIKGKVLVGVDEVDPDFASAGLGGGAKDVLLETQHLAGHTHNVGSLAVTGSGPHSHGGGSMVVSMRSGTGTAGGAARGSSSIVGDIQVTGTSGTGDGHVHGISGDTGDIAGSQDQPHENMPPFYTIYMWRRSA